MLSNDFKRRGLGLALFIFPVMLVKTTSLVLGRGGPLSAQASSLPDQAPVAQPSAGARPSWSEGQLGAAQRIKALRAEAYGEVPLLYPEIPQQDPVSAPRMEPEPLPRPAPKQEMLEDVVLQVIMASRDGSSDTALINGRPYRIGDTLRGWGWIITEINSDARSVTLKDPRSERTIKKVVELPK